MIKFNVEKRFSGQTEFTAEIDCDESAPKSWKLRLAVFFAIKNKISLTCADLTRADLTCANLTDADLTCADLTCANLTDADLTLANLTDANLTCANLTDADLTCANLTDADLTLANLTDADLSVLQTEKYTAYIQPNNIQIGGKHYTAQEWFAFSDDEIEEMDEGALEWWKKWKAPIMTIHATFGEKK